MNSKAEDQDPISSDPAEPVAIILVCADCKHEFPFSPGEQDFFKARGFPPPKRCPLCRKWKKWDNEHRKGVGEG